VKEETTMLNIPTGDQNTYHRGDEVLKAVNRINLRYLSTGELTHPDELRKINYLI
jgi:hypothetical protein